MIRLLFISALILLLSGCCKLKVCRNDDIPLIVVKILEPLQGNNPVMLYELNNGKKDSSIIYLSEVSPCFNIFPVNDYNDTEAHLRKFIIHYKNRWDTIHHISTTFEDIEIVCNTGWGCGNGLGKEKTTLKKLTQFGFVAHEKFHGLNDTLVLN